ncbi:Tol-Pal system beta propeller repeat protein TolB [Rhodobacter sp. KR11]|jgi:TolB protein|uniref:Tol-Pal system beta propeller repeat protein TolB n=1 Tax=Rhodobacter sp. KR11 TaxID=2974588 RepID=UPI0022230B9C|nr:Tol-Pal system beta propeller repeat protein TolB [Rhodobacter sp. KR11]MCW1919162.1 Tol-Pal system beta propeller repeat protein TolB [Rhodobacter sp. KR11]
MKHPILAAVLLALASLTTPAIAEPTIRFDNPVIEPMPFALPTFLGGSEEAANITQVISSDLTGTGLFREIPASAYISGISAFGGPINYADWQAINAQVLITGEVQSSGGKIVVKFQLYDVFTGQAMGEGLQFAGSAKSWRRMAHKVADAVYSRITGEGPYFDSRVLFVSEQGAKDARQKRLAVMDYDGANVNYLTDSSSIVLAPRFSPDGSQIVYISYESGFPGVYLMNTRDLSKRSMGEQPGTMTFAPRFAPDGQTVVFTLEKDGNSDLYALNTNSGSLSQLTNAPSIETAPSFSPDGGSITFESDRSGNQQIYVMPAGGGEPTRISSGKGRYAAPVWSPRGDFIAFTKIADGRFYIGVIRPDGSDERLLTSSFLDESPTWAPNGRVIMFTRQGEGAAGNAAIFSVDVSGRNLHQVPTPSGASDADWSPLLP